MQKNSEIGQPTSDGRKSRGSAIVPSIAELMPVRSRVAFLLPFTAIGVSIFTYVIWKLAPQAFFQLLESTSGVFDAIVAILPAASHLDRASIPPFQIMADNMVISLDLVALIANAFLLVLNLLSYRVYLPNYIRYKFKVEPEEWFYKFRNTARVMLAFSLLCIAEFSLNGSLFELLERHVGGEPISLDRFLYRSALFFSMISSLFIYGLQLMLSMAFAKREDLQKSSGMHDGQE